MKPRFALDLTSDSIALLERSGDGWLTLGTADLNSADLDAQLADLRSLAEGRAPDGFFSKVILPNSQILYLEASAPGPDQQSRRTQIRAALDGRTPYAVDDLVFDWSRRGNLAKVAVVARITLDEAEAFARVNGFRPAAFVAIPDVGDFAGEPYFGATACAGDAIPAGEKYDCDQDPVLVLDAVVEPTADKSSTLMRTAVDGGREALQDSSTTSEPATDAPAEAAAPISDPDPEMPFVPEPAADELQALRSLTARLGGGPAEPGAPTVDQTADTPLEPATAHHPATVSDDAGDDIEAPFIAIEDDADPDDSRFAMPSHQPMAGSVPHPAPAPGDAPPPDEMPEDPGPSITAFLPGDPELPPDNPPSLPVAVPFAVPANVLADTVLSPDLPDEPGAFSETGTFLSRRAPGPTGNEGTLVSAVPPRLGGMTAEVAARIPRLGKTFATGPHGDDNRPPLVGAPEMIVATKGQGDGPGPGRFILPAAHMSFHPSDRRMHLCIPISVNVYI